MTSWRAFVGTNSVRGSEGIYSILVDSDGGAAIDATHQAFNSGAMALDAGARILYAVSESMTFRGRADGGVTSYDISPSGALTARDHAWTGGQRPCRLVLDVPRSRLWVANFFGGTIAGLPVDGARLPARPDVVFSDPSSAGDAVPLMHDVVPLGADRVGAMSVDTCSFVVFDAQVGAVVARHSFARDAFPRSVTVSADGGMLYCMLQDPGEIHILAWDRDRDRITPVQTTSVLDGDHPGPWGTSALRLSSDGKKLVAATRRTNTLSVFDVADSGELTLRHVCTLPGRTPRDFAMTSDGRLAVVAMQASDEVRVVELSDPYRGRLRATLRVPSPASVVLAPTERTP